MGSLERNYTGLSFFEKQIADTLMHTFNQNKDTAVAIVNEYAEVVKVLKDGQETALSFADMFIDAHRVGTTGKAWLNKLAAALYKKMIDIKEFREDVFGNRQNLILSYEGLAKLGGKPYVKLGLEVGQTDKPAALKWALLYVNRLNVKDLQISGDRDGKPVPVDEWRKL